MGERHPTEKRHRDFEEAIPDDRAKRKAGIYRGENDRNNKMKIATDIVSSSDESNIDLEDVDLEDIDLEDDVVFEDEDETFEIKSSGTGHTEYFGNYEGQAVDPSLILEESNEESDIGTHFPQPFDHGAWEK